MQELLDLIGKNITRDNYLLKVEETNDTYQLFFRNKKRDMFFFISLTKIFLQAIPIRPKILLQQEIKKYLKTIPKEYILLKTKCGCTKRLNRYKFQTILQDTVIRMPLIPNPFDVLSIPNLQIQCRDFKLHSKSQRKNTITYLFQEI